MKELELHRKDEIKLQAQKEIEKQLIYLGTENLQGNHHVYEINTETHSVDAAKYEKYVHFHAPDKLIIVVNPNCVYINAMNAENAMKVYNKGGRVVVEPIMKLGEFNIDI